MTTLGIRYAGSCQQGCDQDAYRDSPFQPENTVTTVAGEIANGNEASRVYVAPACYSEVRKVVFWMSFRDEFSTLSQVRLRVMPSSQVSGSIDIEAQSFASSSITRTEGGGAIWTNPAGVTDEDEYYDYTVGNNFVTASVGTLQTAGAQVLYVEFDRFSPGSAAFFNDWDEIAAQGDPDLHIAYRLGIERIDTFGTWLTTRPSTTGTGFSVVQAPATINNTRIYLPATPPVLDPASIVPGVFGTLQLHPLIYSAADFDGTVELRLFQRQMNSAAGGARGEWTARVDAISPQSSGRTERYRESFSNPSNGNFTFCARSADFLSSIVDGDILGTSWRSDTGANQDVPWAMWEITQRQFNKTRVFFAAGPGLFNSSFGTNPRYGRCQGLFDSQWFQALEDARILDRKVQGGMFSESATLEPQEVYLNAVLDDITDTFNAEVEPNLTATPTGTAGYKVLDADISNLNDPINLAGKRKLLTFFAGSAIQPLDLPGGMNISYGLDIPNSEFSELGPVFEVGAFDPEGCASTSAGLGEPGTLIITNGATIPKKFNPRAAGSSGAIEDAGIPTPFEGEEPTAVVEDAADSPTGGLEAGSYKYRYTFRNCCTGRESDPNLTDIDVDTTGASPAARVILSFAGVRIPADPQICEICVYRTVEGGDFPIMAKVGCFDPEETELFVDDVDDTQLDFTNEGLSLLNAPMPCVPVVVEFRNRLFGMGDIPNLTPVGTVSVVNGSDIVDGDGSVEWDRCLEGKFIQVAGDCRAYEILRVLPPPAGTSPPIARLRLTEEYEGESDTGLDYTICGRPNRVYFSEPLEPEYWPAAGFIDVDPGDGDRIMGAVSNFDRLVICKRRKSYVLTFRENPGLEVFVPSLISSDIGCIAPRSFAQVESGSVWLADRGVAIYDGRTVRHLPESDQMNNIFIDPDNPNYIRRDRNGRVIEAVGVFYPKREQYLLLLPTVKTNRGCSLMLVWDISLKNITLLEFHQEFLSMVVGKDADGNDRVYLGDTNGFVWIFDIGDTDGVGVPNSTGTVRGTVTSATTELGVSVLEDSSASFVQGGLPGLAGLSGTAGLSGAVLEGDLGMAGACVFVRAADADPDAPWVSRLVYAATQTELYVSPQWGADAPAPGDEYMLGAIEMKCIFKPSNYGTDDTLKRNWGQILVHEPEAFGSEVRVELRPDLQLSDPLEGGTIDPVDGTIGPRIFRMDHPKGRQTAPVGRELHNFEQVVMSNFAPEEPVRIINHVIRLTPRGSK